MNLYLLTQNQNSGYDTYDSVVVRAESAEEARKILPSRYTKWGGSYSTWADTPEQVQVELIGFALPETKAGVVLASFNAG